MTASGRLQSDRNWTMKATPRLTGGFAVLLTQLLCACTPVVVVERVSYPAPPPGPGPTAPETIIRPVPQTPPQPAAPPPRQRTVSPPAAPRQAPDTGKPERRAEPPEPARLDARVVSIPAAPPNAVNRLEPPRPDEECARALENADSKYLGIRWDPRTDEDGKKAFAATSRLYAEALKLCALGTRAASLATYGLGNSAYFSGNYEKAANYFMVASHLLTGSDDGQRGMVPRRMSRVILQCLNDEADLDAFRRGSLLLRSKRFEDAKQLYGRLAESANCDAVRQASKGAIASIRGTSP